MTDETAEQQRPKVTELEGRGAFAVAIPPRPGYEVLLNVPSHIRDALFLWESEFELCNRVSNLGLAMDDITQIYICLLSNFTRVADLRQRLVESSDKAMLAHAYYCDRVMASMVDSISVQRKNIHTLMQRAQEELESCKRLRWSSERSRREAERVMANNDKEFLMGYRNRAALLREMEQRLKDVIQGIPTLFSSPKKPWSDYVDLSHITANTNTDERNESKESTKKGKRNNEDCQNSSDKKNGTGNVDNQPPEQNKPQDSNAHDTDDIMKEKKYDDVQPNVRRNEDVIQSPLQFTPTGKDGNGKQFTTPVANVTHKPFDHGGGDDDGDVVGPTVSDGNRNINSDEAVVPETPDSGSGARLHVAMETQVSSPRKRKRVRLVTNGLPQLVRSLHPVGVSSPALYSLQAYGDVANPSQPPNGQRRVQSSSESRSACQGDEDVGDCPLQTQGRPLMGENQCCVQQKVLTQRPDESVNRRCKTQKNNSREKPDTDENEQCVQKVLTQKQGNESHVQKVLTQRQDNEANGGGTCSGSGSGSDKILPEVQTQRRVSQQEQSQRIGSSDSNSAKEPNPPRRAAGSSENAPAECRDDAGAATEKACK